jgi:hypothetical protein
MTQTCFLPPAAHKGDGPYVASPRRERAIHPKADWSLPDVYPPGLSSSPFSIGFNWVEDRLVATLMVDPEQIAGREGWACRSG